MGDGVKEDPAVQNKEPAFLAKAGWVKKASGRFLGGYKDRYIHLGKTEIELYDNEDLKTCLERLDLENYDKCLELKSAFKKKNRLVLIRIPKSGNKVLKRRSHVIDGQVQDVKFQAQSPEEKEAWIKAFSDGINRAKNKIFDEVKLEEGSNLEHVTRNRPKGNRNRRPPTRIHMKEVANMSSDGILRLDLDLENATMPNGTHYISTDTTDAPKEPVRPPSNVSETIEEEPAAGSADEEPQNETEPQKKALKPPMPPSKEAKPIKAAGDETTTEDGSEKKVLKPPMPPSKEAKPTAPAEEAPPKEEDSSEKVLKPPMPPSKEAKPSALPAEEATEETGPEKEQEKNAEAGAETGPPPTALNKPTGGSTDNLTEASQSSQEKPGPPTPPSKDKKPALDQHQEMVPSESDDTTDENIEQEEDEGEEENEKEEVTDVKQNGVPETVNEMASSPTISEESLPQVKEQPTVTNPSESTSEEEGDPKLSEPSAEEPVFSGGADTASNQQPQKSSQLSTPSVPTPEPIRKSSGPPALPKKKPVKVPLPKGAVSVDEPKTQTTEETIVPQPREKPEAVVSPQTDVPAASPDAEEDVKLPVESKSNFPAVVLSLSGPMADSPSASPLPCHSEKKEREEEKSIDSPSPLPCHSEKKEREEEKSIDSGQHSDDSSEGSESGDLLAASTAALRGSHTPLDVMDVSDDDAETPDSMGRSTDEEPPALTQTQVDSKLRSTFIQVQLSKGPRPPIPLKPSDKARSASVNDLLSEPSDKARSASMRDLLSEPSDKKRQPARDVPLADVDSAPKDDVADLESEVAEELEKTGELLNSVTQSEGLGPVEGKPGELLAKALEKLKRADRFLREARSLKESKLLKNTSKRNSW